MQSIQTAYRSQLFKAVELGDWDRVGVLEGMRDRELQALSEFASSSTEEPLI